MDNTFDAFISGCNDAGPEVCALAKEGESDDDLKKRRGQIPYYPFSCLPDFEMAAIITHAAMPVAIEGHIYATQYVGSLLPPCFWILIKGLRHRFNSVPFPSITRQT